MDRGPRRGLVTTYLRPPVYCVGRTKNPIKPLYKGCPEVFRGRRDRGRRGVTIGHVSVLYLTGKKEGTEYKGDGMITKILTESLCNEQCLGTES